MRQRLRVVGVFVAMVSLVACADTKPGDLEETELSGDASSQVTVEPEDPYEQLIADFGGRDELAEFMLGGCEEDVREALALYGMTYEVHAVSPAHPKYIGDCPQFFPAGDRNAWHNFDGEMYYIDGSGRPKEAYKNLPPVVAAPRSDSCQTSIGQWGDAENGGNDYDGGHLIGSQLGGWGKRANIAPQDANFNRGNYAQIENKAALCAALPSGRIRYWVTLGYPNSSALIPNSWAVNVRNNSSSSSISRTFNNVDYGGGNGTTYRQAIVSFLGSQGCN